jgi:prepilin-type N-terminal cleavage/methylation domain-containing protein
MQRRHGRGFSLAEVVVAAAVLAIVVAVAAPSLSGYYNQKRIDETAAALESLSHSLNNPQIASDSRGFLQMDSSSATNKYPQKLSHLTIQISTTDRQCSAAGTTAYVAADTLFWKRWGPFSTTNIIPNQGVATPLGWIRDSVVKGSAAAGTVGWVELHMDSLARDDALALDQAIDDGIDSLSGLIRFVNSPSVSTLRFVRFLLPSPINTGTTQIGCP